MQAIHFAAFAGQLHIVKTLIKEHNVQPDVATDVSSGHHEYEIQLYYNNIIFIQDGSQPLHLAAANGHVDIAEYLVMECGVPIESTAQVIQELV